MNHVLKNKRRFAVIVGLLVALGLGAVASRAKAAASGNVTVNQVTLGYNFGLVIFTSNGAYSAKTDLVSPCTSWNRSTDLVKTWYSMAQTAMLSGKRLSITYSVCNNANYIEIMSIVN